MKFQCAKVLTVFLLVSWATTASAAVTSSFELRTTASDTILNPGESLPLEIWMTLNSGSALPNVSGISVFLRASATNAITFNVNTINASGLPSMVSNGANNSPETGDFGQAFIGFPPTLSVAWPNGVAKKVASFSVTALSPATPKTIQYAFAGTVNSNPRPWAVSFADNSKVAGTSPASLTIQVLPEPTAILLLAGGLVFVRGRRRV